MMAYIHTSILTGSDLIKKIQAEKAYASSAKYFMVLTIWLV